MIPPKVLLSRLLSLREKSPFILILDTFLQPGFPVVKDILHRISGSESIIPIHVAFESSSIEDINNCTLNNNGRFKHTIIAWNKSLDIICKEISKFIIEQKNGEILVYIDSVAFIPVEKLTKFLLSIASLQNNKLSIVLLVTCHIDDPIYNDNLSNNYNDSAHPNSLSVLKYLCTSILKVTPPKPIDYLTNIENWEYGYGECIRNLSIPCTEDDFGEEFKNEIINQQGCLNIELTYRRKSGREIRVELILKVLTHEILGVYTKAKGKDEDMNKQSNNNEDVLEGLTTFNLSTTEWQKKAKDDVELPYLRAQEYAGEGGAIVYQYEREDDYDEEEAFED